MRKITPILLFLLISYSSLYAQVNVQSTKVAVEETRTTELSNRFEEYEIVEIDLPQFKRNISSLEETRVLWTVDEKDTFDMRIYPKDIRSPSYQAAIVTEKGTSVQKQNDITTFKGYLSNGNTVRVRLTVDEDFIYGGIQTKEGLLMIRQLKYVLNDKSISPNRLILYQSDKVKDEDGVCATPDEPLNSFSSEPNVARSTSPGCHIIEVAADCDTEYWNLYNDNSFNMMLGEFNMIQDVYEDELDAVISITSIRVFIGSVYTSTNSSTIITEIQNLWSSSPYSSIPRDLVHHFTNKTTGIFGRASGIGAACNHPKPVCFTEDRVNAHQTVAHEIGHLLNGIHGDGADCGTPFVRSIMCQGDNKQLAFSPASTTRLTNYINAWTCFDYNTAYISGDDGMCINNTRTYTLQNFDATANTNITWSTNSRLSIVSGQGNESVVVKGSIEGSGVLTATLDYQGTCGSVTETKNIRVGRPLLTVTVSGPYSDGWITATASGGSSPYTWTLNNTTTWTTTSATTNRYVGCNGGYLFVQASNSCGQGSGSSFVPPCSGGGGYYLTVYPNPVSNEIKVRRNTENENFRNSNLALDDDITLTMFDFSATMVKSMEFRGFLEELKLDVSDLKKGNYFLKISGKDIEEVHQLIIE